MTPQEKLENKIIISLWNLPFMRSSHRTALFAVLIITDSLLSDDESPLLPLSCGRNILQERASFSLALRGMKVIYVCPLYWVLLAAVPITSVIKSLRPKNDIISLLEKVIHLVLY